MEPVTTQSILSRRPAAGGLPQFHLPLPNSPWDSHIPRVTGGGSLSPLSSSINSGSSHNSQTGVPSYSNHSNSWSVQSSNNNSYTYGSLTPGGQQNVMTSYNRHIYSPNAPGTPGTGGTSQTGYNSRNGQSSTSPDDLTHPPYDSVSQPFPMSIPSGATNHSSFSHQPSQSHSQPHSQHLQHAILGPQTSQAPTAVTVTSSESYSRPSPTSGYYTAPSNTPQNPSFPSFPPPHHSPTQLSPTTTSAPLRGIPALSSHQHLPMSNHSPYGGRQYYQPSVQQSLGGAVLSNLGNPSGQVHIMGGPMNHISPYHTAHAVGGHQHMYPGPPAPLQDRPYRCETCGQSFNRNHDLKRHKRIHLAVKPFPCANCEKAFSRKDALKRHTSAKGCVNHGRTTPDEDKDEESPIEDGKTDMDPRMDYGESSLSRRVKHEPA
ncbi:hypothetical protein F5Y17DRAFT_188215 [Xylariaceae sp. FL0594]|nr:hypothetical protein F5Y17DRAFT_188215 [Xylariaceae sp. FL0594]